MHSQINYCRSLNIFHFSDVLLLCCKVTSLDKVKKGYKILPNDIISDLPDEIIDVDFDTIRVIYYNSMAAIDGER